MRGNDYLCIVVECSASRFSEPDRSQLGAVFCCIFVNFLYKSVKNCTFSEKSLGKIWRYNKNVIILQV